MNLRSKWDYIVAHNVWSKVAAALITSTILAILAGVWAIFSASIQKISFKVAFQSVLNYQAPVYKVILIVLVLYVLFFVIKQAYVKNIKRNVAVSKFKTAITEPDNIQAGTDTREHIVTEQTITPIVVKEPLIFDSNKADKTAFNATGEQNWDNKSGKHIGNAAMGDFQFSDNHLIINRQNLDGKFMLKIEAYYYTNPFANYIYAAPTGKNPRQFKVSFQGRSTKGQQRLILILRKLKTYVWLASTELILNKISWQSYNASISVTCAEDFIWELHVIEVGTEPGGFQMKDLLIHETL